MKIKDELDRLMARKAYTRKEVCKRAEISEATLSQYLSGTYNASAENIESKLADFITAEEEISRLRQVKKVFVRTPRVDVALEHIRRVHLDADIFMLTGEPGYGKTTILDEYAAQHRNVIKIDAISPTPFALLRELSEALKGVKLGSAHQMTKGCIKALKGSGKLIMVDEAELLSVEALNTLRRIHDLAEIGVVLAGTKQMIKNMAGQPQLYSRILRRTELDSLTSEEDREAFEMVLASLLPVVNGVNYMAKPEIVEAFYKNTDKGYRHLFKLAKNVVRDSDIGDQGISAQLIKKCAKEMVS